MTTSYPLSLRLKELGVEQTGGEYYWIQPGAEIQCCHIDSILYESWIICRALTLGEVVRMTKDVAVIQLDNGRWVAFVKNAYKDRLFDTPEEAAGELLAETLKNQTT